MQDKMAEQITKDFLQFLTLFKNRMKLFEKILKGDLSHLQLQILLILKGKGTLSMSELAGEMNILKQQLTILTDKLSENSYIERVHDTKDRRSVKISITQCGMDILGDYEKKLFQVLIGKFGQLSEGDIQELHAAIKSMYKIIDKL